MIDEMLAQVINDVRANKRLPSITSISPSTRLREDLGFTSLDLAELTVRIEEKFGVDVFANGLVASVGEVMDRIARERRT